MNRTIGYILIIVIVFTHLGCWDVRDVADSAFVTAIGLDASDKPGMVKVTFVIPKPSLIRTRSDRIFVFMQTVEAESIGRAIEKLQTRLARVVRIGHLRIIVIGEKLSLKNVREFTNFFEKNPEVALRTRISFVQDGEASEVFNVQPIVNRSSVAEVVGLLMTGRDIALGKPMNLQELRKGLLRSNGTVLASRLFINRNNKEPFIEHEGGTVLKEWRVIGWLNENESKAANWFFDSSKPQETGKIGGSRYTLSVDRNSLKIIPKRNGDDLSFLVKVNVSGNVIEEQFGRDLSEPKNLEKVENMLSTTVTAQVKNAVYKSQKQLKTDYLGFGKALEITYPQLYKTLDWPKVYPNVPVTLKVQASVHRFGKTR